MSGVVASLREDCAFHYEAGGRTSGSALAYLSNPSLVAAFAFRMAASSRYSMTRRLARWFCLVAFSSDVAPGAVLGGPIDVPHPTGIVIGQGVRIGRRVRLYQGVTLGTSRGSKYPTIGNDVVIYAGAVIAGGVSIGDGAVIGANSVVTRDVASGAVIKSIDGG